MLERIDQYFDGVAWKRLSAVDAEPDRSNQHELGGLVKAGFKQHLGDPGIDTHTFQARYVLLADDEDESVYAEGVASWYDSRRHQAHRGPELRLYYDTNPVTEQLERDMFLAVAKLRSGELLLVFAAPESTGEQQLRWLFGVESPGKQLQGKEIGKSDERLSWAATWILEKLGIEVEADDDSWLERIIDQFGEAFPPTKQFSAFARDAVADLDPVNGPDETLIRVTETEERFFRLLERHIVQKRLDSGFSNVDDFISYSLSVHNTRKSRAGHSFENHLEFIFEAHDLRFARNVQTELRSKPDFLFPGINEYSDEAFPDHLLTMLGVKTTCKDRWRQVLREAKRIPEKHLATVEPGISGNQTDQMRESSLQLVVPTPLHQTYTDAQRDWLWTLGGFVEYRKHIDNSL